MREETRAGASRSAAAFVLVVVLVVAAVAVYATLAPQVRTSASSIPSSTSSSSAGAPPQVTVVPATLLISPGETQNYSAVELQPAVSNPDATLTLEATAPAGLSFVLNQTSVSLSGETQLIPVVMKAATGLSTGNYSVTLQVTSGSFRQNETVTVDVVQELVVMLDVAFHPQNITVAKGTTVTWMNLDSQIGCCDPGNHDVSFLSGANATSPILTRYSYWSYTFGSEGVVDYYCTIHPWMKGSVTVTG